MNMLFFLIYLMAFLKIKANIITTCSRQNLGILAKRWQPNIAYLDDGPNVLSTINGGTRRYTNMIINCYSSETSYGLIHMDYRNKLSIFAICNNSTLVSSLTAIKEDNEFRNIAKEISEWHKLIFNKKLWISDDFSKILEIE